MGPKVGAAVLRALCRRFGLDALYVFGSRAVEVAACVHGARELDTAQAADLDFGVLPEPGAEVGAQERVRLAAALEDLFEVPRVDLVVLPRASPYLALDVVSGELLCCIDPIREAEYQLFVLRRAGDLAFFERERRHQLLSGIAP